MVIRALSLTGAGHRVGLESDEFAALNGGDGFGMTDVHVHWFDGAGDGSVYQGTRALRRVLPLPVLIRGADADAVQASLSRLAVILDPRNAPATLRLDEGYAGAWTTPVVRAGRVDWVHGQDTNGSTWVSTVLPLESGDPCWTREAPLAHPTLRSPVTGRGLLPAPGAGAGGSGGFGEGTFGEGSFGSGSASTGPRAGWSLTQLRLSSGSRTGEVILESEGDAAGYLTVDMRGPATFLGLIGPGGERLAWSGNLLQGEQRRFLPTGQVLDGTGVDRYDELEAAPVFWRVPPGESRAQVVVEGSDANTTVDLTWHPRRWLVF